MITLLALALAPMAQTDLPSPREHHYRSFNVHAAHKAGCHVSQVHLPVGKPGQAPAIIRCPVRVQALESGSRAKAVARAD